MATDEEGTTNIRLGEWLIKKSLISRVHLFKALNVSFMKHCRLGDALVRLGAIERSELEREAELLHALRRFQPSKDWRDSITLPPLPKSVSVRAPTLVPVTG